MFEGLPVALLEAGAAGCCCVVSGILPNREIIEHEVTGLVVEENTSPSFAATMARALDDRTLREQLGARAKEFIRRRFSPAASTEGLGRVYDEVLRARR